AKQEKLEKKFNVSQSYVSRILNRIIKIVAPAVNEYHEGKITFEEMKYRIRIETANSTKLYRIRHKSKIKKEGDNEMARTPTIKEKFADIISILKQWAIDNPYRTIDFRVILKEHDMKIPSGYSGIIRDLLEKELIESGYSVSRVDKKTKQGGYYLMVTCEQNNLMAEIEQEEVVPIKDNAMEIVEEIMPCKEYVEQPVQTNNPIKENIIFSIDNIELTDKAVGTLAMIIGNIQNLASIRGSEFNISITIKEKGGEE
ncbi:MAG TPA: hypothetical protein PKK61_05575, partial [Defluviitaleaceae bacterium]|nr:hypothetical protein [Defluviitaleaceae bacterium]